MSDTNPAQGTFVTFSNIPLDDTPTPGIAYDAIPESMMEPEQPKDVMIVGVQFKKGGKIYYFDPGALQITTADEVIIDTAKGPEYGFCAEANHTVPESKVIPPLRPVIRIATENDKRTRAEFKAKEAGALELCQEKVLEHKLDMKLVSAEYSFDGSKILFYFTADGRVDFRDLVKDLAAVFRTRIELRQIGVRDEAKMMGGLGICGRPFCCKQFLEDFQPVSIKMAKTQSLSLNPTKISGTCGRLMCCLKYEQDTYEALIKDSPKLESIVNTIDGRGTVTEVNLLKESVKVRLDSDSSTVKCYQNCDICILRNGKGKKTDPPIPEDLPPLPKQETKSAETDDIPVFDESKLGTVPTAAPKTAAPRTETPAEERRTERTERSERTERPQRSRRERGERSERNNDRADRPERSERSDRSDRRSRGGQQIRTNKDAFPAKKDVQSAENKDRASQQNQPAKREPRAPKEQKQLQTQEQGQEQAGQQSQKSRNNNHRRHYRGYHKGVGNKGGNGSGNNSAPSGN